MLFEVIQIEVQCNKNYFRFFLPQKTAAFGNNRKGTAEAGPKIEKYLYFYREYLLSCNPMRVFLQKWINFVKQ